MNLLALDLSLRSTGWATNVAKPRADRAGVFGAGYETGLARLASLRDDCLALVRHAAADLVLLEGIAYAAKGAMHAEICGLHFAVQLALWEAKVPTLLIPPATLKKFATGKGNVDKAVVLTEAVRRLGYTGSDHNVADALWLLQAGLSHYQLDGQVHLPAKQREALAALHWPNPVVHA